MSFDEKEYRKYYHIKNRKRLNEYGRLYRLKNQASLKEGQAAYRKRNQDKIKICKIRCRFQISQKYAEKLYIRTGTTCDICGKPELSKRYSRLAIDHDHKTGKIRGVLCSYCNKALGGFKDNINLLKNSIKYLKQNV